MQATSTPSARASAWKVLLADWKFIGGIILLALILSSLPYIFANATTPSDLQFMGIAQNAPDSGEYFAWMRESMRGFFISNTLTPEPNPPAFFNLVFWLLGRLALYTGMSLAQVYQVLRVIGGAGFLLAAYYLCAIFFADRLQRRLAFLLITFGSGFSLYFAILGKFSAIKFTAQFVSEGTTLYSMISFPLLLVGAALFTTILALAFRAYETQRQGFAIVAGVLGFILGWSHGYDLILVYAVLAAFSLIVLLRDGWAWRWIVSVGLIGILSITPSLYNVWLTRTNDTWRESLAQFVNAGVFSPDPLQLILLMGLPLLVAFFAFDKWSPLKSHDPKELFIKTWFVVNFALIYLPVEYQIHFINGWQVPIGILATIGFFKHVAPALAHWNPIAKISSARQLSILAMLFVLVVLPSSIYFVGWRINDLNRHESPYFLQRDQVAALNWLNAKSAPGDVTLSAYEIGHYVPGLTGDRAFIAHWAMTLKFFDKQKAVARFFDTATPDAERLALLKQFDVQYVYWSDAERALGSWNPAQAAYLEQVWSAPRAAIYRVKN